MACFQATFLAGPHSTGRSTLPALPCPVGPRNSGQSAATGVVRAASNVQARSGTLGNRQAGRVMGMLTARARGGKKKQRGEAGTNDVTWGPGPRVAAGPRR